METPSSCFNRLIDYLILVGPGQGITFEPIAPNARGTNNKSSEGLNSWQNISTPAPSILRQFPSTGHDDFELASDVVYFCQPEGCCVELPEPKTHVFMLTNTETNIRTYGVCLSIPHLFQPRSKKKERLSLNGSSSISVIELESICIQEWGVLSICILSHHPFFQFFAKCLKTLNHFMSNFGVSDVMWNALIGGSRSRSHSGMEQGFTSDKGFCNNPSLIGEIENWINSLLVLPPPEFGGFGLEVELEVNPAVHLIYPTRNRLPLLDLHLHKVVLRIGVHMIIEVFKLVLSEQKVILHSSDPAFSSECIFCIMALLYPLQYLFPVIPLLPSSMPTAENLLMVPTPFLIGVCDNFMDKVEDHQLAETWVIGLDTKEIRKPSLLDQPLLKFPFTILQLQADIRRALDKIKDISNLSTVETPSQQAHHHSPSSATGPTLGEDHPDFYLFDEVDVTIRIIFVQFLFSPELLGQIQQYLCIYRLFPRPVVALRNAAFLTAYKSSLQTSDTDFVQELIKTQCVEYFFQCSLNPLNFAFQDIQKGVTEFERLSDKYYHYIHKVETGIKQVTICPQSPESLLYQEMLSRKALAGKENSADDSDWEVLSGDYYDGGSEESRSFSSNGSSYYSDEQIDLTPKSLPRRTKLELETSSQKISDGSSSFQSDVEVKYFTPKNTSFESDKKGGSQSIMEKKHLSAGYMSPKINILRAKSSSYSSSLRNSDDEGGPYFTPAMENEGDNKSGLSSSSDVETGFRQIAFRRTIADSSEKDGKLQKKKKAQSMHVSAPPPPPKDSSTPNSVLKRGSSLLLKGEKGGAQLSKIVQISSVGVSSSHALELQIQDLVKNITDGQGLPWPKPAYLKRLASQEKTRVIVLRLLEEQLGVRKFGKMVSASSDQIVSVSLAKPVFKGVMELLKYLILCVEEDFLKKPEASIFSMFLVFRIAFSTYLSPKKKKSTIGISLLAALNLSSFIAPNPEELYIEGMNSSDQGLNDSDKPSEKEVRKVQKKKSSSSELPRISISDTDEETEEMHILRKERSALLKRSTSPLLENKFVSRKIAMDASSMKTQSLDLSKVPTSDDIRGRILPPENDSIFGEEQKQEDKEKVVNVQNNGGPAAKVTLSAVEPGTEPVPPSRGDSTNTLNANHSKDDELSSHKTKGSVHQPQTSIQTIGTSTTATPTTSSSHCDDRSLMMPSIAEQSRLSPLEGSTTSLSASPSNLPPPSPPTRKTSPSMNSPSKQAILLSELINSPRFYHPQNGQDLTGCVYMYKELMSGLGHSRNFMLSRHFWNQLFISTVTVDRENMGWNESTVSLYERYNSLASSHQQTFSFKEDSLLSIILHNLLVYMLMVSMSPRDTTQIINRFTARTRLAVVEEKLLQRTVKYIENCIEKNNLHQVDITVLGLMALYSEIHPTISYLVHYGVDVLAPVFKLQITDEVVILRRFPDDKICSRLWNDCISIVKYDKARSTVSVCHKDPQGFYYHHFHTKQYMDMYESLQELVLPGLVESDSSSDR